MTDSDPNELAQRHEYTKEIEQLQKALEAANIKIALIDGGCPPTVTTTRFEYMHICDDLGRALHAAEGNLAGKTKQIANQISRITELEHKLTMEKDLSNGLARVRDEFIHSSAQAVTNQYKAETHIAQLEAQIKSSHEGLVSCTDVEEALSQALKRAEGAEEKLAGAPKPLPLAGGSLSEAINFVRDYQTWYKDKEDWELSQFNPDWASPPGGTIEDLAIEKGWSKPELMTMLGFDSMSALDSVLDGTTPLSYLFIDIISKKLGGSKQFWINREQQYRIALARLASKEPK